MSVRDEDKDHLLAEGIAWREAGRLDESRERMLDLSRAFPGDGLVAYQTAWVHDRLGLESEAVSAVTTTRHACFCAWSRPPAPRPMSLGTAPPSSTTPKTSTRSKASADASALSGGTSDREHVRMSAAQEKCVSGRGSRLPSRTMSTFSL
jgi:hypothetical protein